MPVISYTKPHIKVADELFLVVALLHREHPEQLSFTIQQVLDRARREGLGTARADQKSLKQHAYEHAAANVPPGSGKYRMVYREKNNTIRLLQPGDAVHPQRKGKQWPELDEVPERYRELVEWAKRRYRQSEAKPARWLDGLFQLRGLGKELWRGVQPDDYVSAMRKGWE